MDKRNYNSRMQVLNRVPRTGGAILGVHGYLQGKMIALKENKTIILGRDPRTCDLVVQGDGISRTHCGICYNSNDQTYTVYNYSMNGVFVPGMLKTKKGEALVLPRETHLCLCNEENEILLC